MQKKLKSELRSKNNRERQDERSKNSFRKVFFFFPFFVLIEQPMKVWQFVYLVDKIKVVSKVHQLMYSEFLDSGRMIYI